MTDDQPRSPGRPGFVAFAKYAWDETSDYTRIRPVIPFLVFCSIVATARGAFVADIELIRAGSVALGITLLLAFWFGGGFGYWWSMWRHGHPPEH